MLDAKKFLLKYVEGGDEQRVLQLLDNAEEKTFAFQDQVISAKVYLKYFVIVLSGSLRLSTGNGIKSSISYFEIFRYDWVHRNYI